MFTRIPISILAFIGMLGASTLIACSNEKNTPVRPNVILITIDTLRAESMSVYGYMRKTTPFLEQFAGEADVYTRCMATSPWTLPTHASLFTGLFPYEHGARRYLGEDQTVLYPPMPEDLPVLPEILQEAGYSTVAYSANEAVILPRHGFNRGFDLFRNQWRPADVMNNYVKRGMKPYLDKGDPFFLFINYMDTHIPYNAERIEGFLDTDTLEDSVEIQQALFKKVVGKTGEIPEEELGILRDQYDTAIRHVDDAIEGLVTFLKAQGVYENTLIIITSDHGEFFGEHEMVGHVYELFQEVTHVPLIIKMPGQSAGQVLDSVVSSVDIPGLILDAVTPALAEQHRDTFPYSIGNHPILAECYYGSSDDIYGAPWAARFMQVQTAVWEWPWKLIASSTGKHKLYHLERDPSEKEDLSAVEAGRVTEMLERLDAWQKLQVRHVPDLEQNLEISEEERQALENLGYL